eukprot:TRINITY_DN6333_c0_g1_i1.p1 TRINITY_DN6333_c0_g1~~TRINITY_DN6333_c0_g1_i1.p1  ORF type:complete len:195 (-),score=72.38 TRINITY_DN6333_c0_g1_i1:78-662(-)
MEEFNSKVVVVGDYCTGKTALIVRYVDAKYTPFYKATVGADLLMKEIKLDNDKQLQLHIWDIQGQENIGRMMPLYYRNAVAAAVVFDVSAPSSFDNVMRWKNDIIFHCGNIPIILVGNKCDLKNKYVQNEMEKFAAENEFFGFFFTSAKENIHVKEVFAKMVEAILPTIPDTPVQEDKVILTQEAAPPADPKCC